MSTVKSDLLHVYRLESGLESSPMILSKISRGLSHLVLYWTIRLHTRVRL